MISTIVHLVGLIVLAKIIYEIVLLVVSRFRKTGYSQYGSKEKAWAVVTGASDGIGAEISKQLAEKGFNIVLVSRSEDKLKQVASEISKSLPPVCTTQMIYFFSIYRGCGDQSGHFRLLNCK